MKNPPFYKSPRLWNVCAVGMLAFGLGSTVGADIYAAMIRGLQQYQDAKEPPPVVERTPREQLHKAYNDLAIEHVTMLDLPSAWGAQSKRTMDMLPVEAGCIVNAHYDGELVAQVWIPRDLKLCDAKRYE